MLAVIYAKYFVYVLVRKLFSALQGLLWLLNGTFLGLYRSKQDGNHHRSAQLLDVVYKYKLDLVLQPSGPENFITTHNGFVSPSYVLQDNITLYSVTAKEAVFIEAPEEVNVYDSGNTLRLSQFDNARRIVKVPIAAFHKMAEEIGDPQGELVFLNNTARCGSTLLTQVFQESGCCIGLAEPDALNAIATYKDKMPQDELDVLIRNCVRMQCKPFRNRPISAYILKPTAPTIDAVPMFTRLFPNSKQIFMYREGLKVAQSLSRVATKMPLLALTFYLGALHPRLAEKGVEAMGLPAKDYKIRLPNPIVASVFVWAVICKKYVDLRKQGINIVAVKYEDLVKHPRESTQAIFRYCNLPDDLVEPSIKALTRDSQRNSPLNKGDMTKVKTIELKGSDKVASDALCDKMGLPRIPEPCNLAGTITTFTGKDANGTTQ